MDKETILAISGAIVGAFAAWLFAWFYYRRALEDVRAAQEEIKRHVTTSVGAVRAGGKVELAVDAANLGLKTEAGKRFARLLLGSAFSAINAVAEAQHANKAVGTPPVQPTQRP